MSMLPTTRVALQAVVAAGFAMLISHMLQLDHAYWSTITALFLISNTWGESIKKAFERVAMTVLGGSVGTLLYIIFPHNPVIEFVVLIGSLFFFTYFLTFSYAWSSFFITVVVVFLFAKNGGWSVHLLFLRIYETFLGAVIALIVSSIVLPVRSQRVAERQHQVIIQNMKTTLDGFFSYLQKAQHIDPVRLKAWQEDITRYFYQFRDHHRFLGYEFLLCPKKREVYVLLRTYIEQIYHYMTNLLLAAEAISSSTVEEFEDELRRLQGHMQHNFLLLEQRMQHQKEGAFEDLFSWQASVSSKLESSLAQVPVKRKELLRFYGMLYYCWRVNQALLVMGKDLEEAET